MVQALTRPGRLPLLLAMLVLPATAFAHQLDEYLQAALVDIEPRDVRLKINLTPGVAVADQVLELVDHDRDGVISRSEATAYAELLKRDLSVRLDQRSMELSLTACNFPEPSELGTGWGIIQVEFSMAYGSLAAGTHKLTLENRHLPTVSAYLLNAQQPTSGSVRITSQRRNEDQSRGEIEFIFDPPVNPSACGIAASLQALLAAAFAGTCLGLTVRYLCI